MAARSWLEDLTDGTNGSAGGSVDNTGKATRSGDIYDAYEKDIKDGK